MPSLTKKYKQLSSFWSFPPLFLIAGLFFILLAAYLPVLQSDYIFHDDVYFFADGWTKEECDDFPQFRLYEKGAARPIGGRLKCWYGMSFDTIPEAKYVRLFNVAILTIFLSLLFSWLRICKINKLHSLSLTSLTGFLIAYQPPIAQITNAHHLGGAIFIAIGIIYRAKIFENKSSNKYKILIPLTLFSLAALTYPPSAMLFWAFFAVFFLFKIHGNIKEITINSLKFVWPMLFATLTPWLWKLRYGADSRSTITNNVFEKTGWFFTEVIPLSFNFWHVFPKTHLMLFSLLIITSAGFIILYKNHKKNKPLSPLLYKGLACFGLAIMCFFPMLLLTESPTPHRIFIAIDTLTLFLVFFSFIIILELIKKANIRNNIFNIISIFLLLNAIWTTHFNMHKYYAEHLSLAYKFLKAKLSTIDFSNPNTKIHIILSKLPYLTDRDWRDEFGAPATTWGKYDLAPFAMAILNEFGRPYSWQKAINEGYLTTGRDLKTVIGPGPFEGKPIPDIQNRTIIDMNNIRGLLMTPGRIPQKEIKW